MSLALETDDLTKVFERNRAIEHVTLGVEAGEIVGFLGPNGAGKSTTIRLVLDLIRPTSGRAAVFGHDCQRDSAEVRASIGYLPGDLRLYPGLTGAETFHLIGKLRARPIERGRVDALAGRFELDLGKRAGSPAAIGRSSDGSSSTARRCWSWTSRRPGSIP